MKESNFQFKDPYIINFVYNENDEFKPENFEQLDIKCDFNVSKKENETKAFCELEMSIGEEYNNIHPFFIKIKMGAWFFWEENFDKKLLDDCLNQNAPALLISYIRPIIANITASSKFPSLNIPYIDLRKDN